MAKRFGSHIDGLQLRVVFGKNEWDVPERFGPDGWRMFTKDGQRSVIATSFDWDDGVTYTHASVAGPHMPEYHDLVTLKKAVWGPNGYAYQMFVPESTHVNIHAHALHLWGRTDGKPLIEDFGQKLGSI